MKRALILLVLVAEPVAAQVNTQCFTQFGYTNCQTNGTEQPDNSGLNQMLQNLARTGGTEGVQGQRNAQDYQARQQQLEIQQQQLDEMRALQAQRQTADRQHGIDVAAEMQRHQAEGARHESALDHVGALIGKGQCPEAISMANISGFPDVIRAASQLCARP